MKATISPVDGVILLTAENDREQKFLESLASHPNQKAEINMASITDALPTIGVMIWSHPSPPELVIAAEPEVSTQTEPTPETPAS